MTDELDVAQVEAERDQLINELEYRADLDEWTQKAIRMFRELDAELDGVQLPASAAACANAIRRIIQQIDELTEEAESA